MTSALLTQALDALNRVSIVDDDCDILSPSLERAVADAIEALRTELAKPEPEPIAFFDPQERGFYWASNVGVYAPISVKVEPLKLYAK